MPGSEAPVLEARSLSRNFGGIHALQEVSLAIRPGRVHALLGENGAGKSTLVNIFSGALAPSSGSVAMDGVDLKVDSPARARDLGIRTIHQELELALPLTVQENLLLGCLPARIGLVRAREARELAGEALRRVNADLQLDARVADLAIGDRQVVEIARALVGKARVLIMDEPTAALPGERIPPLLRRVRALADAGVAIVYISHRLGEVLSIADEMTVMRNGRRVASMDPATTTRDDLIRAITGLPQIAAHVEAPAGVKGQDDVECCVRLNSVRLDRGAEMTAAVGWGEVVGFFGLMGAGQSHIARMLYGLNSHARGSAEVLGHKGTPRSPRQAVSWGMGYVPGDRKGEGLALRRPLVDNVLLGHGADHARGIVLPKRSRARANRLLTDAGVVYSDAGQQAGELSGGNQQKIVLARWQARAATRLLLLEEPTRGVDVGAKATIHERVRGWVAQAPRAAMLFSSDPEETATLVDRAYVMSAGRIVVELSGEALTEDRLTAAALAG